MTDWTPYRYCQCYQAGHITSDKLIQILSEYDYEPPDETDGYDSLLVDVPDSFDEVEKALQDGLISGEIYDEILKRLSAKDASTETDNLAAAWKNQKRVSVPEDQAYLSQEEIEDLPDPYVGLPWKIVTSAPKSSYYGF